MRWLLPSVFLITIFNPGAKTASRLPKGWMRFRGNLCPLGCEACDDVNGCLTCEGDRVLYIDSYGLRQFGLCLHACPLGYLTQRANNFSICRKCGVEHCDACASDTYCTHCRAPYLTHEGGCIERCPDDLHYSSLHQTCLPRVDCTVSSWAPWSACTRNGYTCGYKYGVRTRTRSTQQYPSPGGRPCPELAQMERCRMTFRYCADLITNKSDLGEIPRNAINQNKMATAEQQTKRRKEKINQKRRRKRRHRKKSRWKVQRGHVVSLPDIATNVVENLPKP